MICRKLVKSDTIVDSLSQKVEKINIQGSQKSQTCIEPKQLQKIKQKNVWRKSELRILLSLIIQEYSEDQVLDFGWQDLLESPFLSKISRLTCKHRVECRGKIHQLQVFHEIRHEEQGFINFIIHFWQKNQFKDESIESLIPTILEMQRKRKIHASLLRKSMALLNASCLHIEKLHGEMFGKK